MKTLCLIMTLLLFTACSGKKNEDPLKHSKRLIVKGHTSLYNNGMLEIPYTTIKLIPAAVDTAYLAERLFFQDARAALQQGLKDAVESVYIIPSGTKKAYEFSKDVYRVSDDVSEEIRQYTRSGGVWLIDKSSDLAKKHIIGSFASGYQSAKDVYAAGERIEEFFDVAGSEIIDSSWSRSRENFTLAIDMASKISNMSGRWAKEDFKFGLDSFVSGYVALPNKLGENLGEVQESLSSFKEAYESAESHREESSLYFTDIISDTVANYKQNTSDSISKAGENFGENIEKEGLFLTSLKSMRWLLQGVFYDGLVNPLSKLTFGTIGYISVNGVIYPVEVLAGETKATAMVLVEISVESAQSVYDIVAPSMTFALASVLSSAEYLGGKIAAGTSVAVNAAAVGVDTTASLGAAAASKTTSVVLGKGTKYIGVPLAVSARTAGEISYGVLASTSSAAASSGLFVAGEATALTAQGVGAAASGATLGVGAAYSVVSATAQGLYHLSEATVLPTGYTLASGTVLGYGGISQLQAHTVLAASDAAYLVLSLEGPKWVLYSLSGDSIKENKALPAGAVVDLKKMQENNETIKKIEVSDEEIEKVLESLNKDLPAI